MAIGLDIASSSSPTNDRVLAVPGTTTYPARSLELQLGSDPRHGQQSQPPLPARSSPYAAARASGTEDTVAVPLMISVWGRLRHRRMFSSEYGDRAVTSETMALNAHFSTPRERVCRSC